MHFAALPFNNHAARVVGNGEMMRRPDRRMDIILPDQVDRFVYRSGVIEHQTDSSHDSQVRLFRVERSDVPVDFDQVGYADALLVDSVERDVYGSEGDESVHSALRGPVAAVADKAEGAGRYGLISIVGLRLYDHNILAFVLEVEVAGEEAVALDGRTAKFLVGRSRDVDVHVPVRHEAGYIGRHLGIGLCAALFEEAFETVISLEGVCIDAFFDLPQRPDGINFISKHFHASVDKEADSQQQDSYYSESDLCSCFHTLFVFFTVDKDDIQSFYFNLFPYMGNHIWLAGQIIVQSFSVRKVHDKSGPFHLPFFVEQTAGANHMLAQPGHAFQMERAHLHPLVEHSCSIVSFYNKLHI